MCVCFQLSKDFSPRLSVSLSLSTQAAMLKLINAIRIYACMHVFIHTRTRLQGCHAQINHRKSHTHVCKLTLVQLPHQAIVLKSIVSRPTEMDLDMVRGVSAFLGKVLLNARTQPVDSTKLANTYAEALGLLLIAHRTIAEEAIKIRPTRRLARDGMSRVAHKLFSGERRSRITGNDAWESRIELLRRISEISSLSVQQVCVCACVVNVCVVSNVMRISRKMMHGREELSC